MKEYEIDAVTTMYPALSGSKHGYVYRICVILKKEINEKAIKQAVIDLAPRFPIMYTHLKKNFLRYTQIESTDFDIVEFRKTPKLFMPELYDTNKPAFRIYCDGIRMSFDIFHANGDGTAAMIYIKTLLSHYLEVLGISSENIDGIAKLNQSPTENELKDDYLTYCEKGRKSSLNDANAFMLKYPLKEDYFRMLCIKIPVIELKSIIKPKGFTISEYLIATLYEAVKTQYDVNKTKKPIKISVPINLRQFFKSDSFRNFAYFTNVALYPKENLSFDEIMLSTKKQLQKATEMENLLNSITQASRLLKEPYMKYLPRVAKDFCIKVGYKIFGRNKMTLTFSNMGVQALPKEIKEIIDRFEIHLGSTDGYVNSAAIGFDGYISMCMCFSSEDKSLENKFIEILESDGINVTKSELTV
ncbi:MAG: hypothetical protein RRZ68_01440 [Oscillospiraceae bacterium]